MTIIWTSDLNTGIDVIDNQHRRIVDYINELEIAVGHNDRTLVGRVMDELVDYTQSHFIFEESLQVEAGYKLAKPHKAVHDMFIKRVAKYQEKHNSGEDIAGQLHVMLTTWLLHHIKRDDMAYVSEVGSNIDHIVQQGEKKGSWFRRAMDSFFN